MSRLLALALLAACAPKPAPPEAEAEPAPDAAELRVGDEVQPDAADMPMSPARPGLLDEDAFAALHQLTDAEAPEPKGVSVELGDGTAYLSLPQGVEGPVPGVVVVHEWWGLNDHIRHWADRLAADGYAALAVDLYGGKVATTPDEAKSYMKAVDEEAARATLAAAHDFLQTDARVQAPRTGSIGWCFGGGWSLQMALQEPELDAAVVYYGRLVTDTEKLEAIEAPILGIFAEQDEGIPMEAVREFEAGLQAVDTPFELHTYDAQHAFANPSGAHYDADAAADAWSHTRDFLETHLIEPADGDAAPDAPDPAIEEPGLPEGGEE